MYLGQEADKGLLQNQIDVNNAPSGWDNPKVYFMKVPDEECR